MAPTPARRPVQQAAAAKPTPVNFFGQAMYSQSLGIPEGKYAVYHNWVINQFTKQSGQAGAPPQLRVQVVAYPLTGGKPSIGYYSVGSGMKDCFQPDPDNPKRLLAIPGAPAKSFSNITDWAQYRNALLNAEPTVADVMTDDFSVIDGAHVSIVKAEHTAERKAYSKKKQLQRAAEQGSDPNADDQQGDSMVAVIEEVISAPWLEYDGIGVGGGMPEGAEDIELAAGTSQPSAAPTPAPRTTPAARPAAAAPAAARRAAPAVAAPVVQAPAAGGDDDEIIETAILEQAELGAQKRMDFRTAVFKNLNSTLGRADLAQRFGKEWMDDAAKLNATLSRIGFSTGADGKTIGPA